MIEDPTIPDIGAGAAKIVRTPESVRLGCTASAARYRRVDGFKQAGTHPVPLGSDRGAQRRAVALRANC